MLIYENNVLEPMRFNAKINFLNYSKETYESNKLILQVKLNVVINFIYYGSTLLSTSSVYIFVILCANIKTNITNNKKR